MSKFSRALEQAEQERALRNEARASATLPAVEERIPRRELQEPSSEPSGEVPRGVDEHLVSLLTPASFETEQYRVLRHTLEQSHRTAGLSVVAVSSPAVGDGKTITAINLAGALAQAPEARVLVVDADLRRPSMGAHLGLGNSGGPGLVNAILDPGLALEDVARPLPPFNLSVLPAGRRPATSYELLKSPRLGELLEEARARYDYIVLDTPPLVPVPDCRVIGKWVDGFLVVVAAHRTPRKLVEEALTIIDPPKIVGLVFNGEDRPLSGYYYYAYHSTNGDGAGWWRQAAKKLGGSLMRRTPFRARMRHERGR